jgi:hypothetical protein
MALEQLRATLEADPQARASVIPLALDTSIDARRSASKMLTMSSLGSIVGPLNPEDLFAVAPGLDSLQGAWVAPIAVTEGGFVDPEDPVWARRVVEIAAQAATSAGAQRVVVAGWDPSWPTLDASLATIDLSLLFTAADASAAAAAVRQGDAAVWLGSAQDGARFIRLLRERGLDAPVWMGAWAADVVLLEHLRAHPAVSLTDLYFVGWQHSPPLQPATTENSEIGALMEYLVRQAGSVALSHMLDGDEATETVEYAWTPTLWRLKADGDLEVVP